MPPAFMRGVARRAGGSPAICNANSRKAHIAMQCGKDPSDPAAPGFARIHRATSPINRGGKSFFYTKNPPFTTKRGIFYKIVRPDTPSGYQRPVGRFQLAFQTAKTIRLELVPGRTNRVSLDCRHAECTTVWVRALPGYRPISFLTSPKARTA